MNTMITEIEAAKKALPGISDRRRVHILNPAAGKKKHYVMASRTIEQIGGEIMTSERAGQIKELVRELFHRDPYAHAIVYGGDGTIFEAVNGIMSSGASETASFSVIPGGSGNDFSSYANDSGDFTKTELSRIDLIKTESEGKVRYSANITNVGLDCDVVAATDRLKKNPLLGGKTSYMAGLVSTFAAKKTFNAKVKMEGVCNFGGNPLPDIEFERELLVTAFANAKFYGGGFKAAPLASITDGLLDVVTIDDVTRREFLSLVGGYKAGSYITEDGRLKKKFADVVKYTRCKKVRLEGIERFCMDGEIFPTADALTVEIVPKAVWFVAL